MNPDIAEAISAADNGAGIGNESDGIGGDSGGIGGDE